MKDLKKIAAILKKSNSFLVTSHINPEGDSLGSQLAMFNLLKAMGKDVVVLDHDRVPEHYKFLPDAKVIKNELKGKNKKFDVAIVLDCPNLRRIGKVRESLARAKTIVNIDHHVSNEAFGSLNWVEKNASCVGEMVYKLFKLLKQKISKKSALYLYIAILTDTGSFNYTNTSSITHEIVSELLGYGIEPYGVSKRVYENKALGELKLLGKILSCINVAGGGRIAYATVRRKHFKETGTTPQSCENFVNFARSLKGVDVAVFFRESIDKNHKFHVSYRSSGRIDVNKIAASFGGGGHKSASGCLLYGTYESVKQRVLKRVQSELKRRNNSSR